MENLTAPRPDSDSGKFEWRGSKPGPTRGWGYKVEQLEEWWKQGRIREKRDGTPRLDGLKVYLDETEGKPLQNIWTDVKRIGNTSQERLGYPTQKPLSLMERIITASSNPGDLVLDPFCGCGTTVHSAEMLERRWIGVDISAFSTELVRNRLWAWLRIGDVKILGVPRTVEGAKRLARQNRFEFEKWACGHVGAEGMFHDPGTPGPDAGVDGVLKFLPIHWGKKPKARHAIVQVKSGHVTPDSVRGLFSTVKQFEAAAGVLVCFKSQRATVENNRIKRVFRDATGSYPIIQGLYVEDMLEGQRPNLPNLLGVRR